MFSSFLPAVQRLGHGLVFVGLVVGGVGKTFVDFFLLCFELVLLGRQCCLSYHPQQIETFNLST